MLSSDCCFCWINSLTFTTANEHVQGSVVVVRPIFMAEGTSVQKRVLEIGIAHSPRKADSSSGKVKVQVNTFSGREKRAALLKKLEDGEIRVKRHLADEERTIESGRLVLKNGDEDLHFECTDNHAAMQHRLILFYEEHNKDKLPDKNGEQVRSRHSPHARMRVIVQLVGKRVPVSRERYPMVTDSPPHRLPHSSKTS